jgi:hypothetical protein
VNSATNDSELEALDWQIDGLVKEVVWALPQESAEELARLMAGPDGAALSRATRARARAAALDGWLRGALAAPVSGAV